MPASSLQSDPAFQRLVDDFVAALPARMDRMREAVRTNDLDETRRLAHQLKGAGGGYGYGRVSERAGEVERLADVERRFEEIADAVDRLASECDQAVAQRLAENASAE